MVLRSNQSRIWHHGLDSGAGSQIGQVTFSPRRVSMSGTDGFVLEAEWSPSIPITSSGPNRLVSVHSAPQVCFWNSLSGNLIVGSSVFIVTMSPRFHLRENRSGLQ